ncbi:MAG: hypothetical protein R2824_35920 [Saprospiraceae bacterium]|nr:hypothetical protein [Lewinella sp.]
MISPVSLQGGLGGAIGSAIDTLQQRLYFVEYDGKISRLDLLPQNATIVASSNSTILKGTYLFNFDTGVHSTTGGGGTGWDVWWEQNTSVIRNMVARNGAQLAYLGHVNYNAISFADLAAYHYTSDPISANNNADNLLTDGAVFAVRTSEGNFTKVQVIDYGYNIRIRFRTYRLSNPYQVLGTGYTHPEDIVLSHDGQHAYVTERSGNLLRVDLTNADRVHATVVSSGMTAPHQIDLKEDMGIAYVVEYATAGRLLRIDLATGTQTVIAAGLAETIGLLVTGDQQFAYISEQATDTIFRMDLVSGARTTVAAGLTNPFFLTWSDAGESGILFPERDPANTVKMVDITTATPDVRVIATGLPSRPSSVAVVNPYRLVVCSNDEISSLDLSTSVFLPSGPIFMGIGFVPADHITGGYADTTDLSGYHFQVKNAPFGGTLQLMINHDKMYTGGARFYRVKVDGVVQDTPFNTLVWRSGLGRFVSEVRNPVGSGFFRTRPGTELWYTPFHGYNLNTSGLPNGLHTISLELYTTSLASGTPMSTHALQVMIDNSWPIVSIDRILHHHHTLGLVPVGTCGIVTEETDQFQFEITVRDMEGHLKSWNMVALWGDNASAPVDDGAYDPATGLIWAGPAAGTSVPTPPWTAVSRRCAHTFRLTAWDRVIDGYRHLHRQTYHKSITLLLP